MIVFGIGAKMLKSRGQTGFETKNLVSFGLGLSHGLTTRVSVSRPEFLSRLLPGSQKFRSRSVAMPNICLGLGVRV